MNQAEKERAAKVGKKLNVKAYIKADIEAIRTQLDRKAECVWTLRHAW